MNESQEHLEQMTQLSWGHSVDIPGLGQVMLSHDGNVLFNPLETCNSSIHIEVPSMLLLNSAKYTDIDVEATAAFLINSNATLDNLTFHGNGHDGLKNGLFIDDKSTLQVQNLTLENALLLNAGELSVGQELNFNGGSCFNAGNLISTAPNSSFKNATYFFNSKKGKITIKEKRPAAGVKPADLSHNRKKRYILDPDRKVDFLVDLGVQTKEGRIINARYDKFRQINRFLEFIEDVLPRLPRDREISILDFGCGKSYLTFAMYYYLKELKEDERHKSEKLYRLACESFIRECGDMFLSIITYRDIKKFRKNLEKRHLSPTTIRIYMTLLKVVIHFAEKRKMCKYEDDPFEDVQLPSANVRELDLTIDELKAIRDLDAPKYNIMVARDIFMLSYYLEGMNLVDILQVDFRKPYIEYYRTKTKNKKQEAVSKLK